MVYCSKRRYNKNCLQWHNFWKHSTLSPTSSTFKHIMKTRRSYLSPNSEYLKDAGVSNTVFLAYLCTNLAEQAALHTTDGEKLQETRSSDVSSSGCTRSCESPQERPWSFQSPDGSVSSSSISSSSISSSTSTLNFKLHTFSSLTLTAQVKFLAASSEFPLKYLTIYLPLIKWPTCNHSLIAPPRVPISFPSIIILDSGK